MSENIMRASAVTPTSGQASGSFEAALQLEADGKDLEAEKLYRQILTQNPDHAGAIHRLGLMALRFGNFNAGITFLAKAVSLRPAQALYAFELGNAYLRAQRGGEAAVLYRRALGLDPNLDEAQHNLGLALCATGDLDAGFAAMRSGFTLRSGKKSYRDALPTAPSKKRHDREQLEYLVAAGIVDSSHFGSWQGRSTRKFNEAFNTLVHLEGGEKLDGPAINPNTDVASIERHWLESAPNLVVIDDLLTPAALSELRRYCLGSTVWRRAYEGGYLGAMPEAGFACPLLAQIAEELGRGYTAIVREHRLTQWWAFKYDSQLKGINLHADFAAVNVNFWITPDEANLDPASGGLVVWDVAAPLDWDFATYNQNEPAARAFLAGAGAKPIVVPHRCNRAVIFDSDLFHETDTIRFKDGYQNRRINITMLYGWRG